MPKAAKYWQEDRFYGFQFLNGCNPESIKRCTKLPENFPVTEELVGDLLDKGDTLSKAMEVTFPVFSLKENIILVCRWHAHSLLKPVYSNVTVSS